MEIDVAAMEPSVACPHSPGNGATAAEKSDVAIERVYIGSCTGGKITDFIAAAKLLAGKTVKTETFIVPATTGVDAELDVATVGGKTLRDIFASAGNLSDSEHWAWSENAGWLNFKTTHGGVTVHASHLSGYLWAENIGWVKLGDGTGPYNNDSDTDWGVNLDATGNLSGYGWGENVGWIKFSNAFSQVVIDTATGEFSGHAWGENIGWVKLRGTVPDYGVRTSAYEAPEERPGTLFWMR